MNKVLEATARRERICHPSAVSSGQEVRMRLSSDAIVLQIARRSLIVVQGMEVWAASTRISFHMECGGPWLDCCSRDTFCRAAAKVRGRLRVE